MRALGHAAIVTLLLFTAGDGFAQTEIKIDKQGEVAQVAVDDVIRVIKRVLRDAQTALSDEGLPPLEAVTVTLQTTRSRTTGSSFKLIVVNFGADAERGFTQQVSVKLVPPPPNVPKAVSADDKLYETLLEAILAAGAANRDARAVASANPIPLRVDTVATEITFSVKRVAAGGAGIKFDPIEIGGKGGLTTQGSHKITISFKEKAE